MQYRVYITALRYGCEIIEAKSEDATNQHRISWHDGEITDMTFEKVYE